ncbi:MAG: lysophospholipid acyltransferase family protein [Nitrospirota bacterium]
MGLFKDFLRWFVWFPFRWFLKLLPLDIVYILGSVGGWAHYILHKEARGYLREEMQIIFKDKDEKEIKNIVIDVFRNHFKNELELLLFPTLTREKLARMVSMEGQEKLEKAIIEGNGVILLIAHFGANLLFIPYFGHMGYKFNQISMPANIWEGMVEKPSFFLRKVLEMRTKYVENLPVRHISATSSLKQAFKCLKVNEILCIAGDGGIGEKTKVSFLKQSAHFPIGPFAFAAKTHAVVLPAFMIRQKNNRHKLIIESPFEIINKGKRKEYNSAIQAYAKILEKYVYKYPDHYGWLLYSAKTQERNDKYPFIIKELT